MTDETKQIKINLGTWLETKNKEDKSNKVTSISDSSTDAQYPSAKCVNDELAGKADLSDLATVATTGDYDDLTNKPSIPTATSDLVNDGEDGTHPFLTEHQDITGKEDTSNKVTSITASSTDNQYPSAKCVYDELEDKADADDIPTKTSDLTNDGDGTNPFLTQHQDISGKEDKSSKVTSWSGTPSNGNYPSEKLVKDSLDEKADTNSLATVATTGDYDDLTNKPTIPTVVDTIEDSNMNPVTSNAVNDGLALKANTGHTHTASELIDTTAHTNINTAANATQAAINTAIDNLIGSLLTIELIKIDTAGQDGKPATTASADTMNKLYLTKPTSGKEDNYAEFITVRSGNEGSYTYDWEKIGDVSLDLAGYVQRSDVSLTLSGDELILTV